MTSPLRLYKASDTKTLNQSASFHEKFRSAAVIEDQFWGKEVSISAPCRDGEFPPEPSPLTPPPSPSSLLSPMMRRCSSPPGLSALPVAMWFISLSDGVIFMWSWALYLVELVDVTLHLLCYSSGFILVISGDTLCHDVKVTVCALCVSLWLVSLWIVGVCLEPSSAVKVTAWGNLDWGMQTLRSAL
jgi:hypothetical protein